MDAKTSEPVRGCGVAVSPLGFEQMKDLGATDAQGRVRSPESFRHVAFVRLSWQGRPRAQVPIPLVDDQPVEFRLTMSEELEIFAQFEYRYRQWAR